MIFSLNFSYKSVSKYTRIRVRVRVEKFKNSEIVENLLTK